jgi:hypothetical protein
MAPGTDVPKLQGRDRGRRKSGRRGQSAQYNSLRVVDNSLRVVDNSVCGDVTRAAGSVSDIRVGQGGTQDVSEHIPRTWANNATILSMPEDSGACGVQGGCTDWNRNPGGQRVPQHVPLAVMEALHEAAERIAAEGVREVIEFHGVAARPRPARAEEGQGANPHAELHAAAQGRPIGGRRRGEWLQVTLWQ